MGINRAAEDFLHLQPKKKHKPQEFKAARIDEHILADLIIKKFRQYRFWSTKRLKQDLEQPEAYLKEVLSKYCELVKTGPAANNWRLKPEYEPMLNMANEPEPTKDENVKNEDIAPDASGDSDGDDSDEDDLEMEDV